MGGEVLVTGSSRGIGRAIAVQLARDGYDLVLHCLARRELAEEVAGEVHALGRAARVLQFDVTDRGACEAGLSADIAAHGAYYGVVCNAGLTHDAAFPAMSGEAWDSVLRANLDAFYNVLQPVVMPMVRRHAPGRIVTVSSVSGLIGNRGQVNYAAAKGALNSATKALALEVATRGITVNAVAPGIIATAMTAALFDAAAIERLVPLNRAGLPEEVAAVVAFLASEEASYVTAQIISVSGGMA